MNWDDPAARAALIERVGIDRYNAMHREHVARSTLVSVKGYAIRPVSGRFGRIFMIDGTGTGYATLDAAKRAAAKLAPRTDKA